MKNKFYTPEDIFAVARDEAEIKTFANNDVYKFYMLDFILNHPEYKYTPVEWKMTIRNPNIKTAKIIPEKQLIEQLKATQNIVWMDKANLDFLDNLKFPNWRKIFSEKTIEFLKTFKLPDFEVKEDWNWNYEMTFVWPWQNSMMWEIFWLKIINTLYLYNYIKKEKITDKEFNQIIQTTISRLFEDIETFKSEPDTKFAEFGTRRSMSTDFQKIVNQILEENLPNQYLGTSNVNIARKMNHKKVIWTNAHELRMVTTALYDNPEDIINENYNVDIKWAKHFPELAILLPDTYGTTRYFKDAPKEIIESHIWNRIDSKDPFKAIPEYIDWLVSNSIDPMTKTVIPSDGLIAQKAVEITKAFKNKIWNIAFWIGTNLTNNTKNTWPRNDENKSLFGSFSVVIKPSRVQRADWNWASTVKLSDNPNKATWEIQRVEKFKQIFGVSGFESEKVEI